MNPLVDPFNSCANLASGCGCGKHASHEEHDRLIASSEEHATDRLVESALLRALFPADAARRHFLAAVGKATAAAAIGSLFPLDAAKALAKDDKGPLERKDLRIGFVPVTCATPLIMAEPMGFYAKEGLGKTFEPAKPDEYLRSFAVKRS